MSTSTFGQSLILVCSSAFLAGCADGQNMLDLQEYVASVNSRPGGEVEPLPEFIPPDPFAYGAANLRSPFDIPVIVRRQAEGAPEIHVQPDLNRTKEELELHALGSLTMVGMMQKNNVYVALIRDENNKVHRVAKGDHMGRNFGRVMSVSDMQIDIMEIVTSGAGGWGERPRTLTLQQE